MNELDPNRPWDAAEQRAINERVRSLELVRDAADRVVAASDLQNLHPELWLGELRAALRGSPKREKND